MKLKMILAAGMALGSTAVFAGTVNCTSDPTKQCAELDIIVRDFQVTHPDFENFQEEAFNSINNKHNFQTWTYPGYVDNPAWQARRNDYATWGCGNSQTPSYGIPIGTDGYPKSMLTATNVHSSLPDYLMLMTSKRGYTWYGEFKDCKYDAQKNPKSLKVMRGYAHELCTSEAVTSTWNANTADGNKSCGGSICNQHSWSQIVYVTPGMVQQHLVFNPDLGEDMMYEPIILTARAACDNEHFDQWYADYEPTTGQSLQGQGVNARMNTVLQLPLVAGTKNTFEIDYNWNNGGYFPLDVVDANNNWTDMFNGGQCQFGAPCNYGPQSLSIFCPPYVYEWAANQEDYAGSNTSTLCKSWLGGGGPRTPTAALNAARADASIGLRHLRNYGFTMMGYAKFKYNKGAGEVFEFAGDDDMWIYVDGVLAVDLGGTHLAAPGKAEMDTLAKYAHGCHPGDPLVGYTGENENCNLDPDLTWKNGSWHHLHFFYADRQTDGSNMKIHSTLSELAKSRYGQPAVGEAVVKVDEDGHVTNSIFLNTPLDEATATQMQWAGDPASGVPSILVLREVTDPATGATTTVVYGFVVNSLQGPTDKGADGILYNFEGTLIDAAGNTVSGGLLGGDKIAFNVMYDDGLRDDGNDGSFTSAEWEQLIAWSKKMPFKVTSQSGKPVEGFDGKDEWADIQYTAVAVVDIIPDDPGISRPDFTKQADMLTSAAGSDGLKEDMTADLVLTSIPAVVGSNPLTWAADNAEKLMKSTGGAVPTSVDGVPVISSNVTGLMQGTSQTLCYNDGSSASGNSSSESCTSFAFATTQPFHVNIRVFDHLGNFVSQFNKSVTKDDFTKALGQGQVVAGCDADHPLYGGTGAMLANIKMYPVSQSGRQLATGPYIYQVAIVMEQYEYCYMSSGASPTIMTMPYMRTAETYRRGYRRAGKK